MLTETLPPPSALRVRGVFATWWPLAASWLLMGLELPAMSAVVARLASPTVNLAAYGGVVFPLALLIESPIIMLLAASTALARDGQSYRLLRRCMFLSAGVLTAFHALVAFTPLYDVVVRGILGAPDAIVEPARIGMRIMTPWSIAIAYRRFQQGILIRFGRAWAVSVGTSTRLFTNLVVLGFGFAFRAIPGIVVGTLAVASGVVIEAIVSGLLVRPVLRRQLRPAPAQPVPLTLKAFLHFYAPLAATPLIGFFALPLASAAMGRMPDPIHSLAVWPVVTGLVFTLRSAGFAMNEVVVSLLDRPGAVPALRRFSVALAAVTSLLVIALAATPLGALWLGDVSALPPPLVALGRVALWLAVPWPALSALQSWWQGAIVHGRRTRGVTESVAIGLGITGALLALGIASQRLPGLPVALGAVVIGNAAQVAWLEWRARPVLRALEGATAPPARPTTRG